MDTNLKPRMRSYLIYPVQVMLFVCMTVIALAQPVANFSISPTSKLADCPPHPVQFVNQSSGATSYLWEFSVSGPNTSTLKDPQWVFYNPGQYTVKLTAYNGSQSNTMTKTYYITVYDTPQVNFTSANAIGCAPHTVNFTQQVIPGGTSATYYWVFTGGTPTSSTSPNPSVQYPAGQYTVTLKATNNHNCVSSKTLLNFVSVKPKPTVNFSGAPLTFCGTEGDVTFNPQPTGGSLPYTYLWRFYGNGVPTSNVPSPTYKYFNTPQTSYGVKLIVTDANNCKDSLLKPGYVNFIKTVAGFNSPASACVGVPVTFTNTTTPCVSTSWWDFDYPNGATSTAQSPTYTYATAGTKTIKMASSCGPCPDTITKTITIHPKPEVDFTIDPDSPCPAPIAIQFIPNASYSSYHWQFGSLPAVGMGTSTSASPIRNYTANGFDTVLLTVNDANGCTNTKLKAPAVKIFDLNVEIVPDTTYGCVPLTVHFGSKVYTIRRPSDNFIFPPHIYDYPWGVKEYYWKFGDGTDSYTKDPVKTYTDTGVFKVVLRVTTNNNCVEFDTFEIEVGLKPDASFISPDTVCFKETMIYINTADSPYIDEEIWYFHFLAQKEKISYKPWIKNVPYQYVHPLVPGPYCIGLINRHNGCPSDTFVRCIFVDSPKAYFEYKAFCHKDSLLHLQLINQSVGPTSWRWDFGDGNFSTTAWDTLYKYASPGNYVITLSTYNSRSGCRDTFRKTVAIVKPEIDFVANDTTICKNQWVHFTASVSGSTIDPLTSYFSWNIDGVFSTVLGNTFDSSFSDTGYHKITLSMSDEHGCPHTKVKDKYILVSKPYVNFAAQPSPNCVADTIFYRDNSKVPAGAMIANRAWTFNGSTSPSVSLPRQDTFAYYPTKGKYKTKLVVTDNVGCKDSLEKDVDILKPVAAFNINDTGCLGGPMTFFNNSQQYKFSYWYFGDGDTSILDQPDHEYKALGSYDVKLIVVDSVGCADTVFKPKKVNITKPFVSFTVMDSVGVCLPFIPTFTNNTTGPNLGNFTWEWDLGNGLSGAKNPATAYTDPGVYNIKLIATTPWGCKDSAKAVVRVYGYAGSIDYSPKLGCVPLEVDFTPVDLYNIPKIIWDFNDGNVLVTTNLSPVKHTYYTSGAYLPKIVLEDMNGCKSTSPGKDTIKVDEAWADFGLWPSCEYRDVHFYDSSKSLFSQITAWSWFFDTSGTSLLKDPIHKYGPPGEYPVKLIVRNANGCLDTLERNITIHGLPDIDAGADTVICLNDSAILYPTGGVSYVWTPASYLSCTNCTNPKAGPTKRFLYTVEGTDIWGCKNKDTVEVDIKTKVTAITGEGGEICNKESMILTVEGADTYKWVPADGLSSDTSATPVAAPGVTTNYLVISYEGSCIPDSDVVKVIVHPLPTIEARGAKTIIAGNTADLQAQGNLISRFLWSPSESLNCTNCSAPTAKPTQTTTYKVIGFTDKGCADSATVTITVLCDKSQVFMPNTFTPNGDGQNDVFYPRGAGLGRVESLRIYNRWGEVVYEARNFMMNDAGAGWDGTFKGKVLPPDVYVYTLFVRCDNDEIMQIKGDVSIVR